MQASAHTWWRYLWLYLPVTGRTSSAIDLALCLSQGTTEFVEHWPFVMGTVTQRNIWKMPLMELWPLGELILPKWPRALKLTEALAFLTEVIWWNDKHQDPGVQKLNFLLAFFSLGKLVLKKFLLIMEQLQGRIVYEASQCRIGTLQEIVTSHCFQQLYVPKEEFLPCSVVLLPPLSIDTIHINTGWNLILRIIIACKENVAEQGWMMKQDCFFSCNCQLMPIYDNPKSGAIFVLFFFSEMPFNKPGYHHRSLTSLWNL